MIRNLLVLFVLAASLGSCQKNNDKNPAVLGAWKGVNWLIEDKPSDLDAARVRFEFKENGAYSAGFGDQQESGTWRSDKDKLYTKADGKQEIMVKILKVDGTHLDFEMNRGGRKETLQLEKAQ